MIFEPPEEGPVQDTLTIGFLVREVDIPLTTRPFAIDGEEVYNFIPSYGEAYFMEGSFVHVTLGGHLIEWPSREGRRIWRADEVTSAPEQVQEALSELIGTNNIIHRYLNRGRG